MKRVFSILLVLLFSAGLAACAASEPPENMGNETVFRAQVLSVENESMLVEPVEGSAELRASDRISVALEHMAPSPEPQAGDLVEITYNGEILESYPAQLGAVYGITVAEQAEKPEEPEDEPEQSAPEEPVRVEYGYEDVYMALDIPADWDYAIHTREEAEQTDGLTTCSIDFWPQEETELVFELAYWQLFGMCGTGVTIEELTLPNGLTAWKYTEESDGVVWLTVALEYPQSEGTYVFSASPEKTQWETYEAAFLEILESVKVGTAE